MGEENSKKDEIEIHFIPDDNNDVEYISCAQSVDICLAVIDTFDKIDTQMPPFTDGQEILEKAMKVLLANMQFLEDTFID